MKDEYRVQRKDVKWGRGQGYYPLAKNITEAKKAIAKSLGIKPSQLRAMKWKEEKTGYKFSPQARKHLKIGKKK